MANEFKVKKGLIVQGSGSTVLDIQGSQGQLFSVTDSLSGSLFSVNDISGVPIMEVFSDNRVNLGTFNVEVIKVSGSFATVTGSLFGTASYALSSNSASFASTSSYLNSTTNAFIQNGNSFGTTALLGTNDNQPLALETSGSTRMFISSSGNVGIGTISPSEKLDVNGYVKATGFKTPSGTATQFLMADGSTNSNTYSLTSHTHTFASITSKPTTLSGYGITDAVNTSDVVTTATANKILKLDANAKLPTSITGNADGNAATATKLQTARKINGVSFDGSADITINVVDSIARIASSEKGVANGVATLDSTGKVPSAQLPSFVDDIVEYTSSASFPATGETGKIYVDLTTNKCYRWSGTAYVYITSGAVDSVNGKTGVVTLNKSDVGLGNVANIDTSNPANIAWTASYRTVTDTEKTTWNGKQNALGYTAENSANKKTAWQATPDNTSYPSEKLVKDSLDLKVDKVPGKQLSTEDYTTAEKTKLSGIEAGANNYVHPTGDGNSHIPATGTTNNGKVLKAGATANSASWGNIDWSEVVNKPTTFTPTAHNHAISEVTNLQTSLDSKINTSDVVTTATANKILKLDANAKLPASITGNADGNAATATALKTPRTLTIGNTGKLFDGTSDVSWSLAEIGAQPILTNPITGIGTANYLPKFTGASSIGNSVIYESGGNVGIGTTSPGALLDVTSTTFPKAMINFSKKGYGDWGITLGSEPIANVYIGLTGSVYNYYWRANWNTANVAANTFMSPQNADNSLTVLEIGKLRSGNTGDYFHISSFGVTTGDILTVKNSGSVGIGTTSPSEKLDVNGNVKATSFIKSGGTSTQYLMADGSVSTLTNPITGTGTTNYLSKFTASGTIGNSIVYDNGTKVGIGTTSPGAKLTILGGEGTYSVPNFGSSNLGAINILFSTSDRRNAITFSSAGENNAQAGIYVHQDNSAGTHMYFATTDSYAWGPQARLTILNSGNVGIGTTSPSEKLDVSGNVKATSFIKSGGTSSQFLKADGSVDGNSYLPLSGGTMTGSPYISFPASANTSNLPDSTPTGLTYGRLQSFGTMTICGDTDGSTTEYVNITAGYSVANATAANGLSIGYSTLKWKGNTIWHEGNFNPANKADLENGKIPASQLPSYVDDVLEFANLASFPATGESGKIYIAIDTNLTYRWTGTGYAEISASLALGETSSTAYRGDRGKIAYDHSQTTGNPHNTTKSDIGLGNVDNTSDLNKPISTATQTALNTKLNLSGGTMTGALNFKNGTWNNVGDDAAIGDVNVAGQLGIKALNTANPGIAFYNNSAVAVGNLISNAGTLQWSGNTVWHSGNFNPDSKSNTDHTHTFASITNKPTTIAGYGITDGITGTGTANYLPKFTGASAIGNSVIYESGGNVGIGTSNPGVKLQVQGGDVRIGETFTGSAPNGTQRMLIFGQDFISSGTILPNKIRLYNEATWVGGFGISDNQVNYFSGANHVFYTGTSQSVTGTERMRIASSGNVGIGTTSPSAKLDVNGRALVNEFQYTKAINISGANLDDYTFAGFYNGEGMVNAPNSGWFWVTVERYSGDSNWVHQTATTFGAGNTANEVYTRTKVAGTWTNWKRFIDWGDVNGTTNYVSKFTGNNSLGNSLIFDNGTSVGIGTTSPSAKLDVNGDTNITGTLTATVKSFIIDHPTKEGKKLQYGVLEGPEHSVYVRGKLTNNNTITLPDHWTGLVHEDTITVNLTPIGKRQDLWVETVTDTTITVGSDNEINCFYTVFAERKDIEKLVTEFDK